MYYTPTLLPYGTSLTITLPMKASILITIMKYITYGYIFHMCSLRLHIAVQLHSVHAVQLNETRLLAHYIPMLPQKTGRILIPFTHIPLPFKLYNYVI